ncbi:hypothetical protein DLAC_10051 [Tieghemostelium lacteum]|uniref:Transmembrane protein n=1 Tax=Tieghemostelium lacteum TaxID=361077 RepID=A0A151Z604_TIELA|nr:hypothetical protein DLAC_10051 [Tieghemostelium lacteum]|eukprot:KYQ89391.1 hypothetical protein DLAC_10051 [Tieghemostelium lacteum]
MNKSILLIAVILASLCAVQAYTTCQTVADCPSKYYCVPANSNGTMSICVECKSANDCKLNEFCSDDIDLDAQGTCKKFTKAGDDCIDYEGAELTDENVSSSLKCAMFYTNTLSNNTLVIDVEGFCTDGKCRMCDYSNNGINNTPGKGQMRTCVFPGKYETPHSQYWSSGEYYQEPIRVWLAIFFCLIVIQLGVNIASFLFKK